MKSFETFLPWVFAAAVAATGILVAVAWNITSDDSEAAYSAAVHDYWPTFQAEQRERAAFMADHAKGFEEAAERSAAIERSFGHRTNGSLAQDDRRVAVNDRDAETRARNYAAASFVKIHNLRCAKADPKPGKNCELTVVVKAADGQLHEIDLARRFARLDGHLSVVGD